MKEFLNEFLEQFLVESREHVEQATADLLALEKAPEDSGRLDSAFRAFHTLKGGAQIVDFFAMARAVHAGEDVLSALKSGAQVITAPVIGDCLACLDQVVQWLDAIEAAGGELPKDAEAGADRVLARFARTAGVASSAAASEAGRDGANWSEALLARHEPLRGRAMTAIRYTPGGNSFYDGIDPVGLVGTLPGLLAMDLAPAIAWPALEDLDPFACNLVISALLKGAREQALRALGAVADQCEVRSLGEGGPAGDGDALASPELELLTAQVALLRERDATGAAGRLASAGIVAANVLRSAGRTEEAGVIGRASEASLARNDPGLLREAIESVIAGPADLPEPATADSPGQDMGARTLRVDAGRIDALVNLSGELAVAKNTIGHAARLAQAGDASLPSVLKHGFTVLERLVGELQRSVLEMRVLPLSVVFRRFPRLIREISGSVGKPVELVIEGGETEADKAIVEMLFEPLLHVLRNAIDHGIEDAQTRADRGKPLTATIRLRGGRQGEHIVIEVSDDGTGIDVAKVRQVARERAAASEEALASMSDEDAVNLIFEAGFSTTSEVTGLSGRGVGMDAVRAAVERMAGRVELESRPARGTTVRYTLPFSVMMTRVMVVYTGGQAFGIPLDAVVETLRVDVERIVPVGSSSAIVLRDRTVPVVSLAEVLGAQAVTGAQADATLVVTRIEGHFGALRVDRIGERMEVMLKPMDGLLAGMRGIAGSTLLGDGSVLLVLDPGELL